MLMSELEVEANGFKELEYLILFRRTDIRNNSEPIDCLRLT